MPPATTARPTAAPAPADEDKELTYYGTSNSKIVGIQHYRGIVSRRERLVLEREPANAYDRNAIMVMNSVGGKVGHIPRDVAAFLAPYIDRGDMEVEALTGSSVSGTYTIPITVHLFVEEGLARSEQFQRLVRYTFPSIAKDQAVADNGGALIGGEGLTKEDFANQYTDLFTSLTSGAGEESADPFAGLDLANPLLMPAAEVFKGTLLPYQAQGVAWMRHHEEPRVVDFTRVITGEDPASRRKAAKVAAATKAKTTGAVVEPSTKDGEGGAAPKRTRAGGAAPMTAKAKEKAALLAAKAKEERDATSWFWKKNDKSNDFTNVLTNFTTTTAPLMPRGGLLGDAMGLGKTVQMLAVMSHKMAATAGNNGASIVGMKSAAGTPIATAPTLIVCALSLLAHWEEHVKQFLPSFSVVVYHGPNRSADTLKNKDTSRSSTHVDIVVTTYATVGSEGKTSPLQSIQWGRVVLDEAHNIKSAKTNAAKACTSLKSAVRWCVTGTPLQNSLSDLASLIGFLHVDPFNDPKWWQALLIRPMRCRDPRGLERLRCLLRAIVLRRTKDSKMSVVGADGTTVTTKPILSLPPITIEDRIVPMSMAEKVMYDRLKAATKTRIDRLGAGESTTAATPTTAYAEALVLLLRLRQLCNHPHLIPSHILSALKADPKSTSGDALLGRMNTTLGSSSGKSEEVLAAFAELLLVAADETCSICLESISSAAVTECRHMFCAPCITGYMATLAKNNSTLTCPLCRGNLSIAMKYDDERVVQRTQSSANAAASQSAAGGDLSLPAASSKVQAVTEFVLEQLAKRNDDSTSPSQAAPLPNKVVVFSQWPSMLQLLSNHLTNLSSSDASVAAGGVKISCVSLTGSMSAEQRQNAVNSFQKDPSVNVMLLSTMAGSVGLNLVAASSCVLVDPWWNPSIDQQAIMRVHRIGQTRPVTVVRLAMEGSVELNIWDLQRRKQALFEGAFGAGGDEEEGAARAVKKAGAGLSFEELRQFFR